MDDHEVAATPGDAGVDRRTLLKDASLLAGGAIAATMHGSALAVAHSQSTAKPIIPLTQVTSTPAASPVATPVDLSAYAPTQLTRAELATLQAALDRVFPADATGPGANEIGVFVYIDRTLGSRNPGALADYQAGLAALDTAAGDGGFAGLDADRQDAILTDAEGGKLADAPTSFFATLLRHTREGLFSDPIYGGNVNFAGWDLIGYPGIKLVWTEEDQAIDATPRPEHVSVAKYGGTAE